MVRYKKWMAFVLLLMLMLQSLCGCAVLDRLTGTRVQWRDEAVGQAAAQALGKRSGAVVLFEELDQITALQIESTQPVDLTDLSGLVNLQSVDVSNALIEDYTPLLYCTALRELRVGNADYAQHVDVLLWLQENISDTDIDVDGNYFAAIEAEFADPAVEQAVRGILGMEQGTLTCAQTRHVEELTLENLESCDLSDLRYLVGLRELTVKNCGITDLSSILRMQDLLYLNVENNSICDLSGIEALSMLQVLNISDNPVTDLSPIASLENLFALLLQNCPAEDFTVVRELPALTNLSLTGCGLQDVSFLQECSGLSVLWLDSNAICDVSPLASLQELTVLGLSDNRICDISPLGALTNLEYLHLADNNITDISAVAQMQNLCGLQLAMNNILDITPLQELAHLEELSLLSNPVLDFTPLLQMQREWKLIDVDAQLAQQGTDAAGTIAQDIKNRGLSVGNAVGAAHDAVIRAASYDHNAANSGQLGFAVQSTYSALVRGETVCVGYAEALTVILRKLGMEAYIVSGSAGGVEHAWTLLVVDGVCYYIDPTWDDPDEGGLVYRDFLMIGEEKLDETHDWDIALFAPDAA